MYRWGLLTRRHVEYNTTPSSSRHKEGSGSSGYSSMHKDKEIVQIVTLVLT